MNLWTRIAALMALFTVAAVGAAFAADAIRTDDTEGSADVVQAGVSPAATTSDPIPVMIPVWVDTRPNEANPDPVPKALEINQTQDAGGIQVAQPTATPEDVVPQVDTGPIAVEEIDVVAEEAAEEQAEVDVPSEAAPDPTEPTVGVPPLDPNRIGFVDPCSTLADDVCPFGIPALVDLGGGDSELRLIAHTFKSAEGRFRNDGADSCPASFEAGDYNIAFFTSAPASVEVSYVIQGVPPRHITKAKAPQPGSPEYERWIANVADGTFTENDSATWFRTCMSLDLDSGSIYTFEPIIAYAEDGRVTELGYVPHIDTRPDPGSAGRPPVSVVPTRGQNVSVYIWSRGTEDGYRTVAWPVDTSLPDAPSCSDIEADLFVGRQYGMQHSDLGSDVFGVIPIIERQPAPVYDSQWHWRQRFDLSLREGRPYTLCTWEARLGGNSFDNWEILEREELGLSAPNAHPIVMTLSQVTLSDTPATHDVGVYATNHVDFCDQRGPILNASVERAHEGTQLVREVFCETRGLQPEATAFVRVTVDREAVDVLAIPLDATRGCERDGPDPACSTPFTEYFETTVEVPGSCPSGCGSIELQIRVDYLASEAQGIDRWQVGDTNTFVGTPPAEDAGPQIDEYSVELAPVAGRTDALMASFELNRPSDFTITAAAIAGDTTCDGSASGSAEGQVEVLIEGLCADTLYGFRDVTLTDRDGVTNTQNLIGGADSLRWTNGHASFMAARIRLAEVLDESAAAARCLSIERGITVAVGLSEDCWRSLNVAQTYSSIYLGNTIAVPDNPQCVEDSGRNTSIYSPRIESRHTSTAIIHGDSVPFDLYVALAADPLCGSTGSRVGVHTVLDLEVDLPYDDLDEGRTIVVDEHGLRWEIELSRVDAGIGHRLN